MVEIKWFKELHIGIKIILISSVLLVMLIPLAILLFVGSAVIAGISDSFDDSNKSELVFGENEYENEVIDKEVELKPKKANTENKKPKIKKETKKKDDSPSEKNFKLDDKIMFGEMTVIFNDAKMYEKDGKEYIDISFNWINQSGKGKQMFMSLMLLSVKQGDEELKDTEDAWNVDNNNSSPVYFPNAEGGEYEIDLTYELVNDKDIELNFRPLNEYDDGKTIKIELD